MFFKNKLTVFLIIWLHLEIGHSKKQIIFTKIHCSLKSTKFGKVECLREGNDVLTMHITTSNETINNVVGESELLLYMFRRKTPMPVRLKLEICELLRRGIVEGRTSMRTFFYKGIKKAGKNFPDKCPFLRNTTYTLSHMQFDANIMPNYIPEYNFTYNGKFYANNALTMTVWVTGGFCEFNRDCTGSGIVFV